MNPSTQAIINAALAAPKTHVVLTAYEDGTVKCHETRSLATAENWAISERRKIGKSLLSRETGKTVHVVSVEILAIV